MLPPSVSNYLRRTARTLLTALAISVILMWVASDVLHLIRDYLFEYDLYPPLIVILTATILAELMEFRADYAGNNAKVFAKQMDAMLDLMRFIRDNNITSADLLEYSTGTIIDLIDVLASRPGCRIRLLVKNPNTEAAPHQKKKIEGRLEALALKFAGRQNVEIRCYCSPGSLRGRKLNDKFINVGWYTYTKSNEKNELYGHLNCMVSAPTGGEEGQRLKEMFDRAFKALWEDSVDNTAEAVLGGLNAHSGQQCSITTKQ